MRAAGKSTLGIYLTEIYGLVSETWGFPMDPITLKLGTPTLFCYIRNTRDGEHLCTTFK